MLRFTGQAAHSGSTPIPMRRDAFLAAAQTALACREIALRHSTAGRRRRLHGRRRQRRAEDRDRGAGRLRDSLDQRALDAGVLAAMLRDARDASRTRARDEQRDGRMARAVAHRAAAVRSGADAVVRRGGARGNRRGAAAAVGSAARRRGDGAAHAGRDDVRVLLERAVPLQGRRHARAHLETTIRPTCGWSRRPSPTSPQPEIAEFATGPDPPPDPGLAPLAGPGSDPGDDATSCSRRGACPNTSSSSRRGRRQAERDGDDGERCERLPLQARI